MSNYVQKCIDECIAKNPGEIEFHQTVEEVSKPLMRTVTVFFAQSFQLYAMTVLCHRLCNSSESATIGLMFGWICFIIL